MEIEQQIFGFGVFESDKSHCGVHLILCEFLLNLLTNFDEELDLLVFYFVEFFVALVSAVFRQLKLIMFFSELYPSRELLQILIILGIECLQIVVLETGLIQIKGFPHVHLRYGQVGIRIGIIFHNFIPELIQLELEALGGHIGGEVLNCDGKISCRFGLTQQVDLSLPLPILNAYKHESPDHHQCHSDPALNLVIFLVQVSSVQLLGAERKHQKPLITIFVIRQDILKQNIGAVVVGCHDVGDQGVHSIH